MRILKLLVITISAFALFSLFTSKASALTLKPLEYNVDIKINSDSSFEVTEIVNYRVDGEFHGLRRDIRKSNEENFLRCQETGLSCGGFDRIEILEVKDTNGKLISPSELNFYDTQENGDDFFRVEWELYPNGRDVTEFNIGWSIKYKVYGGIQSVANAPYFYWNLLPEDRGDVTTSSEINIEFPEGVRLEEANTQIFSDLRFQENYNIQNKSIKLNLSNLPAFGNLTLAYKFNKGEIKIPGIIRYIINYPPFGADIFVDDIKARSSTREGTLRGITPGNHTLRIERSGFESISQNFSISENEILEYEFTLERTPLLMLFEAINWLLTIFGMILTPILFILAYRFYRKNGKNKNLIKTIVPEFTPPDNIHPYLLGALKDDRVDKEDIVGSIIDLAFRGYLKIKILKKDEYEMTRTEKPTNDLSEIENMILDAIFNGKITTTTKMMELSFPYKYGVITSSIYNEMLKENFFKESPLVTTQKYQAGGFFLLIFSIGLLVAASIIISQIVGFLTIFTLSIPFIFIGLLFGLGASNMSPKTETGARVFNKIKGFQLYLNTAEKYTLQKLEPEYFEKYLSYAVVFKIEQEWAKKFEGIYDKAPEWLEGGDINTVYNAYFISSFARSFSNSTVSAFSVPQTQGSGWTSGGSFGGFSGGGGGGGSSGGW